MGRGDLFTVGTVHYLWTGALILLCRECSLFRSMGHLFCTVGTVRYLCAGGTYSVIPGTFPASIKVTPRGQVSNLGR